MERLVTYDFTSWTPSINQDEDIADHLEQGKVILFPYLPFELTADEKNLLDPHLVSGERKNITYTPESPHLAGLARMEHEITLKNLMARFSQATTALIKTLFPLYAQDLGVARTTFRPVKLDGRLQSLTKDDSRLHVDAFPASPTQGKRILRVFSNINPQGVPRTWRVGEAFTKVAKSFPVHLHPLLEPKHTLLNLFGITKTRRTLYDHVMLSIHDEMKLNEDYQLSADSELFELPAQSTWIVFTDQASHAALGGQHMLEQSFNLPIHALKHPHQSPLRVLEKKLSRKLA